VPQPPVAVSCHRHARQTKRITFTGRLSLGVLEADGSDDGEDDDIWLIEHGDHLVPAPPDRAVLAQHPRHVVAALRPVEVLCRRPEYDELIVEKCGYLYGVLADERVLQPFEDAACHLLWVRHGRDSVPTHWGRVPPSGVNRVPRLCGRDGPGTVGAIRSGADRAAQGVGTSDPLPPLEPLASCLPPAVVLVPATSGQLRQSGENLLDLLSPHAFDVDDATVVVDSHPLTVIAPQPRPKGRCQ
jgi:hypothetical protein